MDYYYQADILFKTGHKEKIERVQQISLFNPDTQKYEKFHIQEFLLYQNSNL